MKQFRFTLQAVQTVRERHEQVAREAYAQALVACHEAEVRLETAERDCAHAAARQREHMTTGAVAGELAHDVAYGRAVAEVRQRRAQEWAQAQRVVGQKLALLVEARRAREVVDKFRQRQAARYERALAAVEQKLLDEMATQRSLLAEVMP